MATASFHLVTITSLTAPSILCGLPFVTPTHSDAEFSLREQVPCFLSSGLVVTPTSRLRPYYARQLLKLTNKIQKLSVS